MFTVPGTTLSIPALRHPPLDTSASNAWLGPHITVLLTGEVPAVRVHVGGGEGAATQHELAVGAGLRGRWFAIADVVQTYEEYRRSRALPARFTQIAWATLLPGAVLNVGRCGPLFGLPGGGEQAEYLGGPLPRLQPSSAVWSHRWGHA
jgi:hypothetical protein